jgi:hypothetical protein
LDWNKTSSLVGRIELDLTDSISIRIARNLIFVPAHKISNTMWLALRRKLDKWRQTDAVIDHNSRPRRHLRGAYYAALWALWVLTGTLFYAYAPKSVSAAALSFTCRFIGSSLAFDN